MTTMSARSSGEALLRHPRESCPRKLGLGREPSRSSGITWGTTVTCDAVGGLINLAQNRSAPSSDRNPIRIPIHTNRNLPMGDRRGGTTSRSLEYLHSLHQALLYRLIVCYMPARNWPSNDREFLEIDLAPISSRGAVRPNVLGVRGARQGALTPAPLNTVPPPLDLNIR
jgi:hypothetical protein